MFYGRHNDLVDPSNIAVLHLFSDHYFMIIAYLFNLMAAAKTQYSFQLPGYLIHLITSLLGRPCVCILIFRRCQWLWFYYSDLWFRYFDRFIHCYSYVVKYHLLHVDRWDTPAWEGNQFSVSTIEGKGQPLALVHNST